MRFSAPSKPVCWQALVSAGGGAAGGSGTPHIVPRSERTKE